MSGRSFYPVARFASAGLLFMPFSFETNDVSDPVVADIRGAGGLSGSDAAAGVANSGPCAIDTITRTGVGAYLVTLKDGYRFVQAAHVDIEDGADTLMPRVGTISNEGAGNTTAVTVAITIRAMATGTATESTGRRVFGTLVLKDSGSGS